MRKILAASFSVFAVLPCGVSFANNDTVSLQLERVITEHITSTSKESESIEGLMKTMHSDSPVAMHLKTQMEQAFPVFDLNVSLMEFSFVGMNGDYAIARVKQKIEKVSGPASLKNHVNDQLFVFKQEIGQWKIWQAAMLDMDYL